MDERSAPRPHRHEARRLRALCGRLLREFGCRDVQVTSYSDDEGIDGVGVLEVSLLSFPVFFQAKRYRQDRAIQPSTVRHRLCELLRDKQLGVVLRPVVDTSFFDAL